MEAGADDVSFELLIKGLLATGATPTDIGSSLANVPFKKKPIQKSKLRPRARSVHYEAASANIILELSNSVKVTIPAHLIEGLRGASEEERATIEMDPEGYALNWALLDVQMAVEGLLAGIFGTRNWVKNLAAEYGRRGGQSKTAAKQAASRANGKLGGALVRIQRSTLKG